jgi:hypothetical protein
MSVTPIFNTTTFPDGLRPGVTHTLEIYEQGGECFIKVMVAAPTGADAAYCKDGKTPYSASIQGLLRVSKTQLKAMYQAMAKA